MVLIILFSNEQDVCNITFLKPKRIFVTGGSGCVGHYLAETLVQETTHELFLLVRDAGKLQFDWKARAGVHLVEGDLRAIDQHRDLLKTMDAAVLLATSWGGADEVRDVNIKSTLRVLELLDPVVCQQVIYFSTASVLDANNEMLPEAGSIGTEYIRSKFECTRAVAASAMASRVLTVFPTLILGGGPGKPRSHFSNLLREVVKRAWLIRFFQADGSLHFIHAQDIARVIRHLLDHLEAAPASRRLVLGNPRVTANEMVEQICAARGRRIFFRMPLTVGLAKFFIKIFRVQMAEWDRFCMMQRHFTYAHTAHPGTFGLKTQYPTITSALRDVG